MMTLYYYVFMPLFRIGLFVLSFFSPKIRRGLDERRGSPWLTKSLSRRPVLIHASSGEFEYAKPLVRALKAQGHTVAVTYFSPSYAKMIAATSEVDAFGPSPWESPRALGQFLDHVKPSMYLVARTDVWPGIIDECHLRGIPTALFSATLTETSKRMKNPLSRVFARWSLQKLDRIFCVSESDKKQFERLGLGEKCEIAGDTRFEQVIYRIQNPKQLNNELKPVPPTIVCGSTWNEDEAVLLPAFAELKGLYRFILAPHEPTPGHLSELEHSLQRHNLTFQRYTRSTSFTSDVLLIDAVGILADLYSWGHIAFVGGSFRKTVHSVMEPLASGCLTLVGPKHQNNREAQELQSAAVGGGKTAVTCVRDSEELLLWLKGLSLNNLYASAIKAEIQKRAHSSEKILKWANSAMA